MTTVFGRWCKGAFGVALALAAAMAAMSSQAQSLDQAQAPVPLQVTPAAGDPPARVGRLSDATGAVWAYDRDAGDWVRAERNRPVTTGDRIATDAGAHADVRIGSTTVRLDGNTELLVARLDDAQLALELTGGSVAVRLRDSESARQFTLSTADGRFTTPSTGSYRFDLTARSSQVSVLSGRATYEGTNSALTVTAGQRAEFWVDDRGVAQYVLSAPTRDAFAAWSDNRDRAEEAGIATRYVSPEMTGVEDLDRNGTWQQTPDYGAVWLPAAVAVDWAPYSRGHWAWVSPWGWTWVDDAPWGFAPFHYGRWLRYHDRWAWAPGSYVAQPCYAPALVGWIGGGPIGRGPDRGRPPQVGWFPLAPREVYVPHYRVSPGYVRDVNVAHVRDIPNLGGIARDPDAAVRQFDYRNRHYAPSITTVPASVLTARAPVAPAAEAYRRLPGGRDGAPRADIALPTLSAPPLAGGPRGDGGGRFADRRRDGMVPPAPVAGLATGRQPVSGAGAMAPGAMVTQPAAPVARPALPGPTAERAAPLAPTAGAERAAPLAPNAGAERATPLPPGAVFGRREAQPFPNESRGRDPRVFGGALQQPPERPAAARPAEAVRLPPTVEALPRPSPPTQVQAPRTIEEPPVQSHRFTQPSEALRSPAIPPARPAVIVTPPQTPPMVRPTMPVAPVVPAQIAAPVTAAPPAAQRAMPEERGRPEERQRAAPEDRGRPDGQRQR